MDEREKREARSERRHLLLSFVASIFFDSMGFTKTIIRAGNGQLPRQGQKVTVHCTGFGKDRGEWSVNALLTSEPLKISRNSLPIICSVL